MFNRKLFTNYIRKSVFTVTDLCELIGLNEQTYFFRMKKGTFALSDFLQICEIIGLTDEQILQILKGEDEDENK